jgi:uncharacterized RDD family membrane protein YckC
MQVKKEDRRKFAENNRCLSRNAVPTELRIIGQSKGNEQLHHTANINMVSKNKGSHKKGWIITSTAFEKIGTDRQLQDHWVRRLIAAIIDGLIVSLAIIIIVILVSLPFLLLGATWAWFFNLAIFPFFAGIFWLFYASVMESSRGSTIGKLVMNLKVTRLDGRLASLDMALIRNLSKIYWILWLIDTIVGMATPGDPHQKYLDRIAGTTVASTIATTMFIPTPPSSTP